VIPTQQLAVQSCTPAHICNRCQLHHRQLLLLLARGPNR
jgi:hypothetical protein